MQDDYKAQLTKATEGLHYCDLILTAQEAECSGQLIPDTVLSFSSAFAGASPSLK